MPLDERVKEEPCAGGLRVCLVDGNAEQNARERKIKRRALAISISLQTLGLAALVIAPMLAKPAELATRTTPPVPIYRGTPKPVTGAHQPSRGPIHTICFDCFRHFAPVGHAAQSPNNEPPNREPGFDIPGSPAPPGFFPPTDSRPRPPITDPPVEKHRISEPRIDPAMLVRRVEPVFPALARQIRRSGKVELHALIGTDGSIQSLQVVSGEPLFLQSALDAVKQWRYRPTYLNGQAVEVDTYITVIYSLQQ